MSTSIPINFSLAPFPSGSQMDADTYGQQLLANLQASITANFMLGQTGGQMPSTNIGPWFDGSTWWAWNVANNQYFPLVSPSRLSTVRNGNMQVWQRKTSFPAISGNVFTADGYQAAETLLTGVATVSRQTVNFTGTSDYPQTEFALRVTVTTPQSTIGANEYFVVQQTIERSVARQLFNKVTSLSLVLQSSVPGTYCVAIRGGSNTYLHECEITSPSTPQYFPLPNIPEMPTDSGTWGTLDTDASYLISVAATCGSTFQTDPLLWTSGNFLASSNQTNLFETGGNTLDITLLQHEPGISCSPFISVPFAEDLIRCQRYYSTSYDYGVIAGTADAISTELFWYSAYAGYTAGVCRFPVQMRISPVVTIYNSITGTVNSIQSYPGQLNYVVPTPISNKGSSGLSYFTVTNLPAGQYARFQYTSSADI